MEEDDEEDDGEADHSENEGTDRNVSGRKKKTESATGGNSTEKKF